MRIFKSNGYTGTPIIVFKFFNNRCLFKFWVIGHPCAFVMRGLFFGYSYEIAINHTYAHSKQPRNWLMKTIFYRKVKNAN